MHRIRWDIDRIAGVQRLRPLAHEADAADAGQTEERLANRVGVPCGACARRECNNRTTKARRRFRGDHRAWNTTPVKVSAAPRLVERAPARITPAFTGMIVLLRVATVT